MKQKYLLSTVKSPQISMKLVLEKKQTVFLICFTVHSNSFFYIECVFVFNSAVTEGAIRRIWLSSGVTHIQLILTRRTRAGHGRVKKPSPQIPALEPTLKCHPGSKAVCGIGFHNLTTVPFLCRPHPAFLALLQVLLVSVPSVKLRHMNLCLRVVLQGA